MQAREALARYAPPGLQAQVAEAESDVLALSVLATTAGASIAGCAAQVAAIVATEGAAGWALWSTTVATCTSAAALVTALASQGWDKASEWVADLFSGSSRSFPRRDLDASTGKLRQADIPPQLVRFVAAAGSEAFGAASGPFEGLWRLDPVPFPGAWGPDVPMLARLFDRDGWVLGPTSQGMDGNVLARRQELTATGRIYWRYRNTWYPWIFRLDAPGHLTASLPDTGQTMTGTLLESPPRPASASAGLSLPTTLTLGLVSFKVGAFLWDAVRGLRSG